MLLTFHTTVWAVVLLYFLWSSKKIRKKIFLRHVKLSLRMNRVSIFDYALQDKYFQYWSIMVQVQNLYFKSLKRSIKIEVFYYRKISIIFFLKNLRIFRPKYSKFCTKIEFKKVSSFFYFAKLSLACLIICIKLKFLRRLPPSKLGKVSNS